MSRRRTQSIKAIYRVRCEQTDDGEYFIKLPDALMASLPWQVGDLIEWRKCRSNTEWTAVNLSVRELYASRFRRNKNSLSKALNIAEHPLLRVRIKGCPSDQVRVVLAPKGGLAFQMLDKPRK